MNKIMLVFYGFLILILGLRFYFYYQTKPEFINGQVVTFETTILSAPQTIGSRQVFNANYENQNIVITTSRFPELNYGDSVRISGPIRILPQAGGLQSRALEGQSNGARKISSKNNRVLIYYPKIEIQNSANLFSVVNSLRQKLINLFSSTLPSPSSNLLLGIIFGIKEEMPKDFKENLRSTGILHVIAASGMNVTLVAGLVSTIFSLFLKRQIAIGLSILAITFYAVLAGLEPSIIRASIMGILVFSAQILGRQSLAINGLSLSAFGMLFWDPNLVSDVGFQLSFAATLGILYVKPLLLKKEGLFSDIATTIAAQVATLPILLINFGTYSVYSILVNALVLWAVPILMMIGGVGVVLGILSDSLGQITIYISYPLLLYFQFVVNSFAKFGGIISIEKIPWQFVAGYYCLLTSVIIFAKKK